MAWRGAVKIGAFSINVKMESRMKKTRPTAQIKTLTKDDVPYKSPPKAVETFKGVEVAKGQYMRLDADAVEAIKEPKDVQVEAVQLVPLSSIDLTLAIETSNVVADDKVPGSEDDVDLLWNGLLAKKMAYVTQFTSGSAMDSILVLYARERPEKELLAAKLPFVDELNSVTEGGFKKSSKKAQVFDAFVEEFMDEQLGEAFEHDAFESKFVARRKATIEKLAKGQKIEVPEVPTQGGTDLQAALEAAVKDGAKAKGGRKRPAKKGRKKVAA